jgi:hypothetical protein
MSERTPLTWVELPPGRKNCLMVILDATGRACLVVDSTLQLYKFILQFTLDYIRPLMQTTGLIPYLVIYLIYFMRNVRITQKCFLKIKFRSPLLF